MRPALFLLLLLPSQETTHWAYRAPVRPEIPPVRNAAWVRNPVDAFVLARLEREGLEPSPAAPKETLIRRATLDLIGLPPTIAEVDAFVADPAPDAYERLVDRLLASPRYGEARARPWLDRARYADTAGHNNDRARPMWRWRDWVVDAFNRDLPFDRFTVEQLAGDLLPRATDGQKIAAGFHRNTLTNDEAGVDPEEVRWEANVDRVNTTATVWLGTTLACAQCHDHKHDPFTMRDYYAFLAFFDNSVEVDVVRRGEPPLVSPHFEERPGPASTQIRVRGSFTARGERIGAATPAPLPPMAAELPRNRLGLARWIADPRNPLAARVAVNGFWEEHFGRPIVESAEDFGREGRAPEHPEMLDWLATEFGRLKFSMKAIHRTIVTSATYRQSSRLTPALLERDPRNRLLARGPRFRMEAERLRDTMLAAAGLLSPRIGGPSVFPPQGETPGFVPNNTLATPWTASEGEDRHRRGIYTFWRRTAPYAPFAAFDAPSREFCTVTRPRSLSPMQALTALNDPAFFEAAQGLAARIVREGGADPAVHGFRLCTSRRPTERERDRVARLAESDGWVVVANVLLNLDEAQTLE